MDELKSKVLGQTEPVKNIKEEPELKIHQIITRSSKKETLVSSRCFFCPTGNQKQCNRFCVSCCKAICKSHRSNKNEKFCLECDFKSQ